MRYLSLSCVVAVAAVLAACADAPPQVSLPPRIEGHVKSVSRDDIREVITLAQRDVMKRYHRMLSVEAVYVANHNLIKVHFRGAGLIVLTPVERVHGVWSITAEWVNV